MKIHIDETTGLKRTGEVVVGGVPLERGAISKGGWFSLKGAGGEHLLEAAPAAWWPDGSVKWMHLCGRVDVDGGGRQSFELTPAAQAPREALRVERREGEVSVRGGVLDVDVAGEGDLLQVRRSEAANWALLESPGLSAQMSFADPDGQNRREFTWKPDPAGPTVVVESANRVVLRLGGTFDGPDGKPASELILFVEIHRESSQLQLQPVFIYLGHPNRDLLAGLTLTVHTATRGDDCTYGFANEKGRGYWDVIQRIAGGPRWPQARQIQLGSSFYRTEKRVGPEGSWVRAVEGDRAQGWCHLANENGGVTAAMRYFWQEYPHSLAVDTDAGTIAFGLRPSDVPPLDLRRYSPQIYGAAVYEYAPRDYDGTFPAETHGASGIAKAHELMLHFHPRVEAYSAKSNLEGLPPDAHPHPSRDRDAAERALRFIHPLRILPDPDEFAATRVIGQLAPAKADGPQARFDQQLAGIADFLVNERHVRRWYGLMDWGDVMIAYYGDRDSWAFDDGGYAWLNTEAIPDYGLWISALRSARSDWFEAAVEMSRHNRDVDIYHRGPFKAYGTRHNVNHWGCADKEWRISMPLVRRLHYYLTADPWTAEVIRDTVAVFQSHDRTTIVAPSMTSSLCAVMVKYEMEHDEKDLATLRNFADVYVRAVRDDGFWTRQLHVDLATGRGEPVGEDMFISHFFMNTFGGQHILVELAETIDHRPLSEALIRHTRAFMQYTGQHGNNFSIMHFMAHAWRQTGEQGFRDEIQSVLAAADLDLFYPVGGEGLLDEPPHQVLKIQTRKNKVGCHLGILMHLIPFGLAALKQEEIP